MAVLNIVQGDSGDWTVKILPFGGETHSTTFHSGTIEVCNAEGMPWQGPSDGEPKVVLT
ncbi:MAG: hypothetical protein J1F05_05765 [Muribaculaceae bacterium]|nr:hypothetical protein [Muribaculaceae bacterium]